jgi:hypothetical protein
LVLQQHIGESVGAGRSAEILHQAQDVSRLRSGARHLRHPVGHRPGGGHLRPGSGRQILGQPGDPGGDALESGRRGREQDQPAGGIELAEHLLAGPGVQRTDHPGELAPGGHGPADAALRFVDVLGDPQRDHHPGGSERDTDPGRVGFGRLPGQQRGHQ